LARLLEPISPPVRLLPLRSAIPEQVSIINGKKAGTDINLYKLFIEQCFNLLRDGGRCGMITPADLHRLGCYSAKGGIVLTVSAGGTFGLSNERFIFDNVDHRFKVCIFSFQKAGSTPYFAAAFRSQPREAVRIEDLDRFLHDPTNTCKSGRI